MGSNKELARIKFWNQQQPHAGDGTAILLHSSLIFMLELDLSKKCLWSLAISSLLLTDSRVEHTTSDFSDFSTRNRQHLRSVVSSPDFSACVRKNTSSYGESAMTTLTNATLILVLLFPTLNRTCCTTRYYTEDCCCTAFIWLQKGSSLNMSQLLLKSFEPVIQTMWSSVIMQYRWHASIMCQRQIPQFCIPVYPKAKVLFSCCHTVHPESLPAKCKCLSDKFMEDLRCFHTAPAQLIPYLEEPRCKAQEGPQANIRTNSWKHLWFISGN